MLLSISQLLPIIGIRSHLLLQLLQKGQQSLIALNVILALQREHQVQTLVQLVGQGGIHLHSLVFPRHLVGEILCLRRQVVYALAEGGILPAQIFQRTALLPQRLQHI